MKTKYLIPFVLIFVLAACSKKDDNTNTPPSNTDPYANTTAGSTWIYHSENNTGGDTQSGDYTLTSTDRDTTINGKKYHIYDNSAGDNEFLNITGSDYYKFEVIPGSSALGGLTGERLYLKTNANAGATWKQDFSIQPQGSPFALPFSLNNTIAEKGISRTVNDIAYTDVIHVSSTITSSMIPNTGLTSAIDMYYAPKYGLIESSVVIHLNYSGFTQDISAVTKLKSAVLK